MGNRLRHGLIKLAYEHPEFRKDLLPLVKTARTEMLARAIATNLKGILEEPSPSEAYPQGMDPSNPGELASQVETIPDLVGLLKRVYNETKGNPMEFLEFCEELRESMRRLVKPSL